MFITFILVSSLNPVGFLQCFPKSSFEFPNHFTRVIEGKGNGGLYLESIYFEVKVKIDTKTSDYYVNPHEAVRNIVI